MGKKKMVKMNMQEFLGGYEGRATLPTGPAQREADDDGRTYGRRAPQRERGDEPVSRSDGDDNWRGGGGGGRGAGGFAGGGDAARHGGQGDKGDRYKSPSDAASSWRSGLSSQDDERYARRDDAPGSRGGTSASRGAPPTGERKKLVLKQRTVPKDGAAAATASSIFGQAKPVQTKESAENMKAKDAGAEDAANAVENVSLEEKSEEPKEPEVKGPTVEEIAAEAAAEVVASKKVGADLVAWVTSQEGLMGKLLLATTLVEVLKLDAEPDFAFKNLQPGRYLELLKSIPAARGQQVEAVFAGQDYCGTFKFPKDNFGNALVYKLFIELYKQELVTDDALEAWKDDYTRISDNKQKAIMQTMKFFEWLLAEDDQEGDDEDDDEDITPARAM